MINELPEDPTTVEGTARRSRGVDSSADCYLAEELRIFAKSEKVDGCGEWRPERMDTRTHNGLAQRHKARAASQTCSQNTFKDNYVSHAI